MLFSQSGMMQMLFQCIQDRVPMQTREGVKLVDVCCPSCDALPVMSSPLQSLAFACTFCPCPPIATLSPCSPSEGVSNHFQRDSGFTGIVRISKLSICKHADRISVWGGANCGGCVHWQGREKMQSRWCTMDWEFGFANGNES